MFGIRTLPNIPSIVMEVYAVRKLYDCAHLYIFTANTQKENVF